MEEWSSQPSGRPRLPPSSLERGRKSGRRRRRRRIATRGGRSGRWRRRGECGVKKPRSGAWLMCPGAQAGRCQRWEADASALVVVAVTDTR
ncbi:hypothetical protein C2845_PM11G06360 [Panicum miliaceum]|uniref:Uncharacterized protein n=1 Tax=Panicum miliaceum TaxID=4540 RepID=A0A3L6RQJ7_PANMI|nr:hypothetical protein C2845_PM11G06360 [Panicum miliaceum]